MLKQEGVDHLHAFRIIYTALINREKDLFEKTKQKSIIVTESRSCGLEYNLDEATDIESAEFN